MKQFIMNFFSSNAGALTFQEIILNFVVAGVLSVVLFLSYRLGHAGTLYSARFNVTLVTITLITTLVMNVIGNNIALSLGMVGALSIIRFRTAIKDARDATYIFWAIGIGICCGVQEYLIASTGSGFIFLFLLAFGAVKNNNRLLLIIRGDKNAEKDVRTEMERLFSGRARIRVANTDSNSLEFIYEISRKDHDRIEKENSEAPGSTIQKIEGIKSVSTVEQNDEVNQ